MQGWQLFGRLDQWFPQVYGKIFQSAVWACVSWPNRGRTAFSEVEEYIVFLCRNACDVHAVESNVSSDVLLKFVSLRFLRRKKTKIPS